MGAIVKAVVELGRVSGLNADEINNDFYFALTTPDDVSSGRADSLRDSLNDFYNGIHAPGVAALSNYMSDALSRVADACTIKFYSTPISGISFPIFWGSPDQTRSFTLGAGAGGQTSMPGEVALVMTYHGDLTDVPETQTDPGPPVVVTRPAARRRGRVFLGPFGTSALTESVGDLEGVPAAILTNAAAGAGDFLLSENDLPELQWVVLSQTAEEFFPVVGGWCDNAWDTQRRRGEQATARTTFS